MTSIPSKGFCHAVFLLLHAARLSIPHSISDWIQAARNRQTIMASALNVEFVANNLIANALVDSEPAVKFSEEWDKVGTAADYTAFLQIAAIYLKRCPPIWISSCFVRGAYHPEFIPTSDLSALHWMGNDLEPVLREVHYHTRKHRDDTTKLELGFLGERVVFELLSKSGHLVRHVSQISDSYGYDIESEKSGEKRYWEVKSCTNYTKDRFFITRNEARQAKALGSSWNIIQVIFRTGINSSNKASEDDVLQLRVLTAHELINICPSQSEYFDWMETAVVRPAQSSWLEPSALL